MKAFSVTLEIPEELEQDFNRYVKAMQDYTAEDGRHPFENWSEEKCFQMMMEAGSYGMIEEKLWEHMYYHVNCITRKEYRIRKLRKQIRVCKIAGVGTSEYEREIDELNMEQKEQS